MTYSNGSYERSSSAANDTRLTKTEGKKCYFSFIFIVTINLAFAESKMAAQ